MKKKIISALCLLFVSVPSWGAVSLYDFKGVELLMPFSDFSVVYLYDFIGKESLIGGETPFIRIEKLKNLTFTIGAVGDASDEGTSELRDRVRQFAESGTPFIGTHIEIDFFKDRFSVGGQIGRNLKEGKNIAGLKSSFKFW